MTTENQPPTTIDAAAVRKEGYDAGYAAGAEAERARIAGIDDLASAGRESLIAEAKADGKSTAADVALRLAKADKTFGTNVLEKIAAEDAALPALGASVEDLGNKKPAADAPAAERAKYAFDHDQAIKAEFGTVERYTSYLKGVESGRIRTARIAS